MHSSTSGHGQNKEGYLLIQILIIAVISIFMFLSFRSRKVTSKTEIMTASLSIAVLFLWTIRSWYSLTGTVLNPYCFFVLATVLFNAGHSLLELFGLNKKGILNGLFTQSIIYQCILMVLISLSTFHFGAMLALGINKKKESDDKEKTERMTIVKPFDLRLIGMLMLILSIYPAYLYLRNNIQVVMSNSYMGLYQRDVGTGMATFAEEATKFLVPASIFLLVGSNGKKGYVVLSITTIGVYSAILFFLGYRGYAVLPLLSIAWIWHRLIRPISRKTIIIAAIVFMCVIFPLVRIYRKVEGKDRVSLDTMIELYTTIDDPATETISEMGNSMKTIAYTICLVPRIKDYDYGASYFYSAFAVVPNLFWDIHPSAKHGNPTKWLIKTVAPRIAANGGSYGFSFIAEAYYNFGYLGLYTVMPVLGFAYALLIRWANDKRHQERMAMVACFSSFFIFYVRNDSSLVFRELIWYGVFPLIGAKVISWFRRRSSVKTILYMAPTDKNAKIRG